MNYQYQIKQYRDHRQDQPISVYMTFAVNGQQQELDKFSCIWCKRTIYELRGNVDKIIMAPMPATDFDMSIQIACKLCKARYRLLLNSQVL